MRALWIVAALIGVGILIFAHATVLGIVVGIAFLGLAVLLYRRPLVHRIGLGHRWFHSRPASSGSRHGNPGQAPEGSELDDGLADTPRRSFLWIDGRHGLIRLTALHVEPIGAGGPEAPAFDLVAARERLHLTALGLLIPEVDRDKCALTADRAGRRLGLTHRATAGRP